MTDPSWVAGGAYSTQQSLFRFQGGLGSSGAYPSGLPGRTRQRSLDNMNMNMNMNWVRAITSSE